MRRYWPVALLAFVGACKDKEVAARADSLQALTVEQGRLAQQLSAQKDSLTTIVLDADAFITRIDSQISRVKGLPSKHAASAAKSESPIEEQLVQRKLMLARVTALVDRAQATARQLEASRKRERTLRGENAALTEQVSANRQLIADLGATITRQTATIGGLQARVDTLSTENQALGQELHELTVTQNRAFYIVGTERDLLKKRVLVRTGGTNLLVARVGRSLQPARQLDRSLFTPVDQRAAAEIPVPDPRKRYRIVSRQSLDAAEVGDRERGVFQGGLRIKDAQQFWGPSKYLIIVQL
jgi:hypothetical protein